MPTVLAERESDHSMAVFAGDGQLQIEDFCESISELLWVLSVTWFEKKLQQGDGWRSDC